MRLHLIDGTSYIYRAFFALPPLSDSRGLPTNAVYGFTNMLLKILREQSPERIAVVFDAGGETDRHREYEAYKAQRPPIPDMLVPQIPYIYRVVKMLQVPTLLEEGTEADDIIGTVATRAVADGFQVTIVSSDKDLFQLVGPAIAVYDPMRDKTYQVRDVEERYGIPPQKMADFMSLVGDAVDNIPGVPGVGEKTASALLQEFGTVEHLLDHLDQVKRPKLRAALSAHAAQIRLNRSLVTLRTDLSLGVSPDDLRRQRPDVEQLRALFEELGFTRLLSALEKGGRGIP